MLGLQYTVQTVLLLGIFGQTWPLPRAKRQAPTDFQIVTNQTIPCDEVLPTEQVALTAEEMTSFAQTRNVQVPSKYLARTPVEADEYFHSLLEVPSKYRDIIMQCVSPEGSRELRKRDILQFMAEYLHVKRRALGASGLAEGSGESGAAPGDPTQRGQGQASEETETENAFKSGDASATSGESDSTEEISQSDAGDNGEQSAPVPTRERRGLSDRLEEDERRGQERRDGRQEDRRAGRRPPQESGNTDGCAHNRLLLYNAMPDPLERHKQYEDFPFFFPEELGIDRHIQVAKGTLELSYCMYRGEPNGNYLRLCTVCSGTRTMGDDMWPPYLNEAVCVAGDDGCLFVESMSHGRCHQLGATISMLQQQPGQCVTVLKDGQKLYSENWTVNDEVLAVGCECQVSQNSFLAALA